MGTAEAGLDYLLNRLPFNKHRLSTDASTSFGLAGVLRFHNHTSYWDGDVDGLL